jgi:hypothetical protein
LHRKTAKAINRDVKVGQHNLASAPFFGQDIQCNVIT